MVQYFQRGPSRSQLQSKILGDALGEGLGNFTGNYLANKSLEGVLNNPKLKNAPVSERLDAMERALAPHGQRGEQLLKRRLGIEQKKMQEIQERKGAEIQQAFGRVLNGQGSPEDLSMLPPELLKAAEDIKLKREGLNIKRNLPPKIPGGISAQPVPMDISQKIGLILGESKGLTSDDLAQKFDEAQIPRAFSNSYIENRRRQDESEPKSKLDIHKLSEDTYKKINEEADSSKKRLRSFDTLEKTISSGKTDPRTFKNFLANAVSGTFLEGLLRDPESEEFKAASFNVYEGLKNVFGARLSDADLRLASTKVPDITKKPEANKKIINFLKFFDEVNVEKQKISSQILKENKGFRPIDFDEQVKEKLDEKLGNKAEDVLKKAVESEPKNLTEDLALLYLDKAKGNRIEAEKMAKEDGYEF